MISGKVDPDEWQDEVDRVKTQLSQFKSKNESQTELLPVERFLENINTSIKLTKQIRKEINDEIGVRKVNVLVDSLHSNLYWISKEEKRINQKNEFDVK